MGKEKAIPAWGDYEGLVVKIAKKYYARLPERSEYHSMEVLRQEGRIAVLKALRTYNPKCSVKLITYIWNCVEQHFSNLLRKEYRSPSAFIEDTAEGAFPAACHRTPEREVLLAEVIAGLAEISKEFVSLILDGVPNELYRRTGRASDKSLCLKTPLKVLEEYFGATTMRKLRKRYQDLL